MLHEIGLKNHSADLGWQKIVGQNADRLDTFRRDFIRGCSSLGRVDIGRHGDRDSVLCDTDISGT